MTPFRLLIIYLHKRLHKIKQKPHNKTNNIPTLPIGCLDAGDVTGDTEDTAFVDGVLLPAEVIAFVDGVMLPVPTAAHVWFSSCRRTASIDWKSLAMKYVLPN